MLSRPPGHRSPPHPHMAAPNPDIKRAHACECSPSRTASPEFDLRVPPPEADSLAPPPDLEPVPTIAFIVSPVPRGNTFPVYLSVYLGTESAGRRRARPGGGGYRIVAASNGRVCSRRRQAPEPLRSPLSHGAASGMPCDCVRWGVAGCARAPHLCKDFSGVQLLVPML